MALLCKMTCNLRHPMRLRHPVQLYIDTYINAYTPTHTWTHLHTHINTNKLGTPRQIVCSVIKAYTCKHICKCMYTHTHTHIYTSTHQHAQFWRTPNIEHPFIMNAHHVFIHHGLNAECAFIHSLMCIHSH